MTLNGVTEDIVVIVQHPKCCSDATSWQRRVNASNALKSYLDSTFPTQKVWVIGDFNDDVDTSIYTGNASPYANFVSDSARYRFPSKALSDAGIASTTDYPDMIDHHLNSNEANATYIASSAEVYRVDSYISSYSTTTSDHYPLLSRYSWGSGGGGSADVIINEILANEPGSDTAGEFVELYNAGTASADLSGWTLHDASSTRHTFAAGTSLAAGKAIVVYGGSSAIPAGLSNAVAASTGTLSLANGGDSVTLLNSGGTSIDGFTYSSTLASSDGVSINLSPDGSSAGVFVKHNTISALDNSPGTRASGSAW
ncbi:MAG: lamin tail domain-containing protein [Polyangiaceae bacterium]